MLCEKINARVIKNQSMPMGSFLMNMVFDEFSFLVSENRYDEALVSLQVIIEILREIDLQPTAFNKAEIMNALKYSERLKGFYAHYNLLLEEPDTELVSFKDIVNEEETIEDTF